jgi:hypothetical protein
MSIMVYLMGMVVGQACWSDTGGLSRRLWAMRLSSTPLRKGAGFVWMPQLPAAASWLLQPSAPLPPGASPGPWQDIAAILRHLTKVDGTSNRAQAKMKLLEPARKHALERNTNVPPSLKTGPAFDQCAPAGGTFHGGSLLCLGDAGTGHPVGSLLALQGSRDLAVESLQEGHAWWASDLRWSKYSAKVWASSWGHIECSYNGNRAHFRC